MKEQISLSALRPTVMKYEPYPRKSVTLLKKYLPAIIDVEIEYMGHGQYLHEHSDEYASKLIDYLQS